MNAGRESMPRRRHRVRDLRYTRGAIAAARMRHAGDRFHCPCCGSDLRDMRSLYGPDRICWACGSLERHRLIHLWFDDHPELFTDDMSLLHVAPEPALALRLRALPGIRYVGGDLRRYFNSVRIDVTELEFPDASFDAVICNHVLEHVVDDHTAIREIRRVLKPGAWALLLVPGVVEQGDVTDEDVSVTDPEERLRRFGEVTHVRAYGWDYVDRLSAAGLDVEVVRMEETLDEDVIARCRLRRFGTVEPLFVGRRPSGPFGGRGRG